MEHKIARANFQDQFDILQKKKKNMALKDFYYHNLVIKLFKVSN